MEAHGLRLRRIEVSGFRSLRSLRLRLHDLTCIVGGISIGKSNILLVPELFCNADLLSAEKTGAIARNREHLETSFYSGGPEQVDDFEQQNVIHAKCWFQSELPSDEKTLQKIDPELYQMVRAAPSQMIVFDLSYDPIADLTRRRIGVAPAEGLTDWIDLPQDEIQKLHTNFITSVTLSVSKISLHTIEKGLFRLLTNREARSRFQDYLSRVLDEPIELFAQKDESVLERFVLYIIRKHSNSIQPVEYLSEGVLRLFGILLQLSTQNEDFGRKILLIDDPELHLHARAQRALADLFVETAQHNQIIFSTASTRFLVGEVFLASLYRNATTLQAIDPASDKDVELLAKRMGVRPADSLSADAILFVEGALDSIALRIWFDIVSRHRKRMLSIPKVHSSTSYSFHIPRVAFVPIDGWTKMSYVISVKILREKYVRSIAFALVDGDTWDNNQSLFTRIQQSFESVFGTNTFFRLKQPCLESIFLSQPQIIAKVFSADLLKIEDRIGAYLGKLKDKEILLKLFAEFGRSNLAVDHYSSFVAGLLAKQFRFDQIPGRLTHLFNKIIWETNN